jgi:hypothetical protein
VTDEQAAEVAALIGSLWGVDRGETWVAFYGAAIAELAQEDALRAVRSLFATERFCPTPQEVIDVVAGTTDDLAHAALGVLRRDLRAGLDPGPVARRAAQEVWGGLDGVPLDGPVSRQQTDAFVHAWRTAHLSTFHAQGALPIPTRELPA